MKMKKKIQEQTKKPRSLPQIFYMKEIQGRG
jgi:hypothetical protein